MSKRYDISLHVDPSPSPDFDHFEVYRAPELAIIAVDTTAKTFTIEGKFASWYDVDDELEVALSTGNDGIYTVTAVDETTGDTVITVTRSATPVIPSAVADGLIKQKLLKQLAIRSTSTSFEDRGLPAGYFYYVIYAVDKNGNYSDPSNIITKTAPELILPPAQPTGLTAVRADDFQSVEIFWRANSEEDLKGYILYRSFDGLDYHIAAILGSTANNYKDTKVPPLQDTDSSTTPVMYALTALSKAYIESAPAGPTYPFEIPIVTGLRGIVDYLAINVYWNFNKPEDGITSYQILYRPIGTIPWFSAGVAAYPRTSFRIEGPLTKDSTYEIGIIVFPHTGVSDYVQPLPIPITIPNYEEDTTRPKSPEFLEADLDPESNRIFMSWRRVKIDEDFLNYAIWWGKLFDIIGVDQVNKTFTINGYATDYFSAGEFLQVINSTVGNDGYYSIVGVEPGTGVTTIITVAESISSPTASGMLFQLILDGITSQNNWTFRNMRRHFAREDSPINRAFVLAVTAFDRSGNQSIAHPTAYLLEYWISQDMLGPSWIDVIRTIDTGLFKQHDGSNIVPTPYAQYYLQWNDSGKSAKHFRRYVVYESIDLRPAGNPTNHLLEPIFDFDDESQIRGYTNDNRLTIQNNNLLRGFKTTDSERVIAATNPGARTFAVTNDQRGHFRVGDTVRVYGSTDPLQDKDYTVQSIVYSSPQTIITVVETVPSGSGGRIYDVNLDGAKFYSILSEDWFGDKFAASPTPPYPYLWIEVN